MKLMAQVHMTEAEVARDFKAVLEKVRRGAEIVIEKHSRPVAVIRLPERPGRPIDECIAIAKTRGMKAALDEDFAGDLKDILKDRAPLDSSPWD